MSAPIFREVSLGRLVATPVILEGVSKDLMRVAVQRHAIGDWGDLDAEDKAANDRACDFRDGSRLHSSYSRPGRESIWIITDDPFGELPTTTVLLPSDY